MTTTTSCVVNISFHDSSSLALLGVGRHAITHSSTRIGTVRHYITQNGMFLITLVPQITLYNSIEDPSNYITGLRYRTLWIRYVGRWDRFPFLARDAFVTTNRRAIAMFARPCVSVWDGRSAAAKCKIVHFALYFMIRRMLWALYDVCTSQVLKNNFAIFCRWKCK